MKNYLLFIGVLFMMACSEQTNLNEETAFPPTYPELLTQSDKDSLMTLVETDIKRMMADLDSLELTDVEKQEHIRNYLLAKRTLLDEYHAKVRQLAEGKSAEQFQHIADSLAVVYQIEETMSPVSKYLKAQREQIKERAAQWEQTHTEQ